MKKLLFYGCFCSLIWVSCKSKKGNSADTAGIEIADSTTTFFFPVTSFLKGQFMQLDSLPVTVLQLRTFDNKTDSSWISIAEMKPKLAPFLSFEIGQQNLLQYFKETKFNDQSVDAITYTYDPLPTLPDTFLLRHWDIYINPKIGMVRRVYLLQHINQNGQSITRQLTWQTNKWAKIVTILNYPGGKSKIESEIKFVWDLSEDQ